MMAVNVKFIGALSHIAGKYRTVTIGNGSPANFAVKDLIQKIIIDIPEIKTNIITQQAGNVVKTNILILVNDREISVLNGVDTLLVNGDEIAFISVVHGG
jgi:molybdopterin converting factor small subunit